MFDTKVLKNKTMTVLKSIYNFLVRIAKGLWKFIKDVYSNKKAAFGFSIMMLFLFVVIFGNKIFPYNSATDWAQRYLPSSAEHWLGTDELGRDVFRQLIYGTKNVMMIAFFTALITSVLGVLLGLISGLIGGWVDKIIQAVTNLFLIIPSFPILLLLAQLFTIEDPISFSLVLSVWGWAGLCRAIRSEIMTLRERDFIQICTVMKMSRLHIVFKELIPNISSFILINFIMIMRNAITSSVGIMTLGLAAFEPSNWGVMLHRARMQGLINPAVISFMMKPLCTIILFEVGAILFTNGLDEILNPRLRKE